MELQKIQESEGLHLANKLKLKHIRWQQQKMKVNLAAQALSSSVADAIQYSSSQLNLPQFIGIVNNTVFIVLFVILMLIDII